MVNRYIVKDYAKKYDPWFTINDDNMVVNKETGKVVCHIDILVQVLREKMHCDFETVHDLHGLLQVTLRCKECGTVIFAREDESWEPNLCCPVCSNYKTSFEYWSGEDIAADKSKQEYIKGLEDLQREQDERYERRKKRKGKFDWQIARGRIKLYKRAIRWDLECDNLFKTKLKGLRLKIHWLQKDGESYIFKKHFTIPLSLTALKRKLKYRRDKNV